MFEHKPIPMSGGTILREPKGGPDVTLLGAPQQQPILITAGNILSVQGWTARLALLDNPDLSALTTEQRNGLIPPCGPYVCVSQETAPDPADIAKRALKEIRS